MRILAVCIGLALAGGSAAYIWYQSTAPSPPLELKKGPEPIGAEGHLPIPEDKFLPDLEKAKAVVTRQYGYAKSCRFWGRVAGWAGLLLTSAMTILAGFYGGRPAADGNAAATLEQLLKEQQRSKGLMRVVGVLVATSTLPALFAQKLESDAAGFATSGRELNKVLLTATDKLYDTKTKPPEARRALNELAEAVEAL